MIFLLFLARESEWICENFFNLFSLISMGFIFFADTQYFFSFQLKYLAESPFSQTGSASFRYSWE